MHACAGPAQPQHGQPSDIMKISSAEHSRESSCPGPGRGLCRPRRRHDRPDLGAVLVDRLLLVGVGRDAGRVRRVDGRLAVGRPCRRPPRPARRRAGVGAGRRRPASRPCAVLSELSLTLPIIGVMVLAASTQGALSAAVTGAIPALVAEEDLSGANGVAGAFKSAGFMLGPGVGGALLAVVGRDRRVRRQRPAAARRRRQRVAAARHVQGRAASRARDRRQPGRLPPPVLATPGCGC